MSVGWNLSTAGTSALQPGTGITAILQRIGLSFCGNNVALPGCGRLNASRLKNSAVRTPPSRPNECLTNDVKKTPRHRFCRGVLASAVSESPGFHRPLAVAGIRDLQIPGETVGNPVQFPIGTTRKDFYVGTADLAGVLGVTANELSQLHRSSILERIADPRNKKAVLYPVFDSIRRYCEYRRTKRLAVHEKFLEEKAGREKAQRLAIEMTNRQRGGELVDKAKLIAKLEPVVIAYRDSLLARTDRLVGELIRTKSRKEKVRRLREADTEALRVLSDLFIRAGKNEIAGNGAKAKMS
jgi:hypothetical protein